jgi:dipeptidase E
MLVSNSTAHGSGYLDHCAGCAIHAFRAGDHACSCVPYALFDRDAYAAVEFGCASKRWGTVPIPHDADVGPVRRRKGRGDLHRRQRRSALLDALWRESLIEPIRHRVRAGAPYIGTSAGSNVACPSIRTWTNDMSIVQAPSFSALDLRCLQHQPGHDLNPTPGSTHMGETVQQRDC